MAVASRSRIPRRPGATVKWIVDTTPITTTATMVTTGAGRNSRRGEGFVAGDSSAADTPAPHLIPATSTTTRATGTTTTSV
jgi:hypothetical protein